MCQLSYTGGGKYALAEADWCSGLEKAGGGQNRGALSVGGGYKGSEQTSLSNLGHILAIFQPAWHHNGLLGFGSAISLAQIQVSL